MNPIRDALIGGVLPGAIATITLSLAGLAIALKRGPLPSVPTSPAKPQSMSPSDIVERAIAFVATLLVGAGVLLSMRLLESYPGWWPVGINNRTPAMIGFGVAAAALVAAGPGRWWFALPACVLGGAAISYGVREPLPATENLPLAMALDALAVGVAAFLIQLLIDRVANAERGLLARPLPIVALTLALGPAAVAIFNTGTSVSARQFGVVPAVLMSAAIVLAVFHNPAGRVVLRGVGVLVAMAIGVWMLVGRTIGVPDLTVPALVLVLLSAAGVGVAAILVPRLNRWWLPAVLTLALVGAPMGAAAFAQRQAATAGDDAGGSPADYGY